MTVKAGRGKEDLEKFTEVTFIYWKRYSCYRAQIRRSGSDDNELNFLRYVKIPFHQQMHLLLNI
jgi:hypothetical protein